MSLPRRIVLGFLSLAALAASGTARGEVVLTDHHILEGEVVSSTEDSVTLTVAADGEPQQMEIPVDHIEPYSFYVIRDKAIGKDAAARMRLAQFCLDAQLYSRARKQFEKAMKLDPSLKTDAEAGIASAREGSAGDLVSKASSEQAGGKANEAMRTLSEAVRYYGDTATGDKARGQVADLHQQMLAKRAAERSAKEKKAVDKELKKVQTALDTAAGHNKDGLQAKEQSQSKMAYEKSLAAYKRALAELKGLEKKYKDDAGIVQQLEDERKQAEQDIIGVHMNLGSMYITRSSYQQALGEANKALAIDANDSRALAFRNRVQVCSSRGMRIL